MTEFIKRIFSSLILFPFLVFVIYTGSTLFILFTVICLILTNYEWYKMTKKKFYYYFGLLFIFFSYYTFYKFRIEFNYLLTFFVIFICILTDIGGYSFGKILKGPKLLKISPNKTYSGLLGSFLSPFIFFFLIKEFNFLNMKLNFNSFNVYVFIFIVSAISQLGDIFISYFKRISKLKDTGNIIPGHGGLLDRIDGMIFAIPFSYILFKIELLNLSQ